MLNEFAALGGDTRHALNRMPKVGVERPLVVLFQLHAKPQRTALVIAPVIAGGQVAGSVAVGADQAGLVSTSPTANPPCQAQPCSL